METTATTVITSPAMTHLLPNARRAIITGRLPAPLSTLGSNPNSMEPCALNVTPPLEPWSLYNALRRIKIRQHVVRLMKTPLYMQDVMTSKPSAPLTSTHKVAAPMTNDRNPNRTSISSNMDTPLDEMELPYHTMSIGEPPQPPGPPEPPEPPYPEHIPW